MVNVLTMRHVSVMATGLVYRVMYPFVYWEGMAPCPALAEEPVLVQVCVSATPDTEVRCASVQVTQLDTNIIRKPLLLRHIL